MARREAFGEDWGVRFGREDCGAIFGREDGAGRGAFLPCTFFAAVAVFFDDTREVGGREDEATDRRVPVVPWRGAAVAFGRSATFFFPFCDAPVFLPGAGTNFRAGRDVLVGALGRGVEGRFAAFLRLRPGGVARAERLAPGRVTAGVCFRLGFLGERVREVTFLAAITPILSARLTPAP